MTASLERFYCEQGQLNENEYVTCRHNVQFGSYNPFRAPPEEQAKRRGRTTDQDDKPARSAPSGNVAPAQAAVLGSVTGKDRATATPYVPPTFGKWEADAFGSK